MKVNCQAWRASGIAGPSEFLALGISDAALLAFDMRTAVAVAARASAALAGSPFGLLDAASTLRLVTDLVHEDDALCLALACRALRDVLWERFPATFFRAWNATSKVRKTPTQNLRRLPPFIAVSHMNAWASLHLLGEPNALLARTSQVWLKYTCDFRLRTRNAAVFVSVARLLWAMSH